MFLYLAVRMINYSKHKLKNGLTVIVHEDPTVQIAVLNLIYNVGSKDENPEKTGFAHLFEHLMFGGSKNAPDFDGALQAVGGENNAFTSLDVTNYYMTLPAANIETAFWLESDRMLNLNLDPNSLEVQRKVVIEEFKQRYLNQPYGNAWLELRPLAYKKHSYSWATIGKEVSHIEDATLDDVQSFFNRYYVPNNAVLVLGGNIKEAKALELAEQYFGSIPAGEEIERSIITEPKQEEKRTKTVYEDVPQRAIYKVYHTPARTETNYYSSDLLSDILGRGKSSRLYKKLVLEKQMMTDVSCYLTGSFMPGLLVVNGRVKDEFTFEEVEEEIGKVLTELIDNGLVDDELTKVKNQAESSIVFGRVEVLEKCIALAYAELLGNSELVNEELGLLNNVSDNDIQEAAKSILREENSSVLYYDCKK